MKLPSFRTVGPAKVLAVLAVVAGAVFASVLPSAADVSAQSPSQPALQVQSPAQRLARGAAISVDVSVVCPVNWANYVNLRVTQRVGPGIAKGYGYAQYTCTGSPQTITINLHAEDHAFRAGIAFASANMSGGQVIDEREIAIVNP
ncbi:hypothetical protein ALI22I_34840 [Saccharothrix sp. ALI-22-I]|uniref:hypothetical protein n=1 Tax=Saccharothrix sp. ALI-22-I TaxID=1933778 RepID=UPI00097BC055|nr:hypothetical protein [Saccharothrix sp. ALI-22-I]ONI83648.1 hypothetical protein ALI22I_34840 [Saccharothrix sp. ALI-22-I]